MQNEESNGDRNQQLDFEFHQHLAGMKRFIIDMEDKNDKQMCALWIKKLCDFATPNKDPGKSARAYTLQQQIRNSYSQRLLGMLESNKTLSRPFDEKPPSGPLKYLKDSPIASPLNDSTNRDKMADMDESFDARLIRMPSGSNLAVGFPVSSTPQVMRRDESAEADAKAKQSLAKRFSSSYFADEEEKKPGEQNETGARADNNYKAEPIYISSTVAPGLRADFPMNSKNATSMLNLTEPKNNDECRLQLNRDEDHFFNSEQRLFRPASLAPRTDDLHKKSFSAANLHQSIPRDNPEPPRLFEAPARKPLSSAVSSDLAFYDAVNHLDLKSLNEEDKLMRIRNLELEIRRIEVRFQEEKLNLQQQHDASVKSIIDRKNGELETLQTNLRKLSREYDDNVGNLERKVQALNQEILLKRDEYDKSISELKKQTEETLEKRQKEYEKTLTEVFNKGEKEKFDMQKQHTKAFQDLVEETNLKLKRVECEYNEQQTMTDKVILELENKTQLLRNEMEKNIQVVTVLEKEKKELLKQMEMLERSCNEMSACNRNLEKELAYVKECHEKEMLELKETIHHNQMKAMEEQNLERQKVDQIKEDMEKVKTFYEKKIHKNNKSLKEKDHAIIEANLVLKQTKMQAEEALNDLKKQIDENSRKLYDEMRDQMAKVEADLERSKCLRENQQIEYQNQIDLLTNEHKREIEKLQHFFELEKLNMKREFESKKKSLHRNNEAAGDKLKEDFHRQMADLNNKFKARVEQLNNQKMELENEMLRLKQDLVEANSLRKQQIIELGILRDDEKARLKQEKELEIDAIVVKFEQEKAKLREALVQENEASKEELSRDLRQTICELNERSQKQAELMNELKNENLKLRECQERDKNEMLIKLEEEKIAIKNFYHNQIKNMEHELDSLKCKQEIEEKRLKQMNSEHKSALTALKMKYEEKLKGLLPKETQRDLEETISCLKSQIRSLQQKVHLLETEMEEKNNLVNSSTCSGSY